MPIEPECRAAGFRVIGHECVGSTNAEALALARAGDAGPVWITARAQSQGRGRRGRDWHSPPGNLYASLLLREPCAPPLAPQLSFVAALAVHDALTACAPHLARRLALKWPNDLLLDGAKIAGILVEGEMVAGALVAVIGIGLNCASHPPATPYPASNLALAGVVLAPEEVLQALAPAMAGRLAEWARGEGFARTRAAWVARAAQLGEPILLQASEAVEGIFDGIDEAGRLLLRSDDGSRRAFAAADVQAARARSAEGAAQ